MNLTSLFLARPAASTALVQDIVCQHAAHPSSGPVLTCNTMPNVLLLLAGLSGCAQEIHGKCQYHQVQFDCTC